LLPNEEFWLTDSLLCAWFNGLCFVVVIFQRVTTPPTQQVQAPLGSGQLPNAATPVGSSTFPHTSTSTLPTTIPSTTTTTPANTATVLQLPVQQADGSLALPAATLGSGANQFILPATTLPAVNNAQPIPQQQQQQQLQLPTIQQQMPVQQQTQPQQGTVPNQQQLLPSQQQPANLQQLSFPQMGGMGMGGMANNPFGNTQSVDSLGTQTGSASIIPQLSQVSSLTLVTRALLSTLGLLYSFPCFA
jgi:hypothetical protein